MKSILVLLFAMSATCVMAQTKEEEVLKRVELLNSTVFGTKDSTTLDDLLAEKLTYGHSHGNLEDRPVMLHNATTNGNTYAKLSMEGFSVFFQGKTAIVRYTVTFEQTTKGVPNMLTLGMLQVWVKEHKKWKLTARQAVRPS